jgi:serine/threonine protein phosphatase PrpC
MTRLTAVCDGHGGHKCCDYLANHFLTDIFRAARAILESTEPNLVTALVLGFRETEEKWMAIAKRAGDSSGACLTAVLVRNNRIAGANVGDCRAILRVADGDVQVLTSEHRCVHLVV